MLYPRLLNFPHNATVEDIKTAYMIAYESKCKGITVYRDGSKDNQVLSTGATPQTTEENGVIVLQPKERPQIMRGVTELVNSGHGKMYITINFDENEQPFEVFGVQGKSGGCDSALLEAISRLTSMALRSGIDPQAIVDQLQGITCCPAYDNGVQIKSAPDALALVLNKHLNGHNGAKETPAMYLNGHRKCVDCNTTLNIEEGCEKCPNCGWNKC